MLFVDFTVNDSLTVTTCDEPHQNRVAYLADGVGGKAGTVRVWGVG
jgi:hypothetical protein